MELTPVGRFGIGAGSTECIGVCPPAAYVLFKVAHLGLHAAMDMLAQAAPHAFSSDVPAQWPRQWTAPTPMHQTFLDRVYPFWGPRDDGALACISIAPAASTGKAPSGPAFGRHVPVQAAATAAPTLLRALLDPRVLTLNPLLDVMLQHGVLTCRVVMSLLCALVFVDGAAPLIYKARGATTGSRRVTPLASHSGQAIAVWHLHKQSRAQLLEWPLPPLLRGHVGAWVLSCPVRTNAGAGTLLLFPAHLDAGMLPQDWAAGTLPQLLWDLSRQAAPVPLQDIDAVAVPWLPTLHTKTRIPCLEGLAHAQWVGDDMDAGAAVIEGSLVHTTWTWAAETATARCEAPRTVLALPEGVLLCMLLAVGNVVVQCILAPGHVLGRAAGAAPADALPFQLNTFVPWGHQ